MIEYNKDEIKNNLSLQNIYDIVEELGGEPQYTDFGLICLTICHNPPNSGSRKLYYYENTNLFRCYTGCQDTFDIFELIIKSKNIVENKELSLFQAMLYVVKKFNLSGTEVEDDFNQQLKDWELLNHFEEIHLSDLQDVNTDTVELPEFNKEILDRFSYPIISSWKKEGISVETMKRNLIGYYPGDEQITIPHFDKNGRFIGLRGRALVSSEAAMFGKYRPVKINNILYNHPLRLNLYNFNNSKDNIKNSKTAIVFESEKATLQYQSMFGTDNDISVAMCGSSLSDFQVKMLLDNGTRDLIVAFDRQFQEIGDEEFKHLKANIMKINHKFKNYLNLSFIFDKDKITSYKASPTDEGADKFIQLLNSRITLI
jgi:hypothetical protein